MRTTTLHPEPPIVEVPASPAVPAHAFGATGPSDARFLAAALQFATALPTVVTAALSEFRTDAGTTGALLLRGLPIGQLPATPATPARCRDEKQIGLTEQVLLGIAQLLGEPVGYLPELGGDIVQNIVPVRATARQQISTSSRVNLVFHTEAAFHPHRPRYLLLLCLRGDPHASTTLASIRSVLPLLPSDDVAALFQPRFRATPDQSYLKPGTSGSLGPAMAVLSGHPDRPTMVFDAETMVGTDEAADAALRALSAAVAKHHTAVTLQAGDLLVVDNHVAVHGRTAFTPRFDGTDRWLQRTFVVEDLEPSASEREGRVITTLFD